jgi:hypothetical protein
MAICFLKRTKIIYIGETLLELVKGYSSTMCWMVSFPHRIHKRVFTNVPVKQHIIAFAMAGSKAI